MREKFGDRCLGTLNHVKLFNAHENRVESTRTWEPRGVNSQPLRSPAENVKQKRLMSDNVLNYNLDFWLDFLTVFSGYEEQYEREIW